MIRLLYCRRLPILSRQVAHEPCPACLYHYVVAGRRSERAKTGCRHPARFAPHNAESEVTGALLATDRNFAQVLEGERGLGSFMSRMLAEPKAPDALVRVAE